MRTERVGTAATQWLLAVSAASALLLSGCGYASLRESAIEFGQPSFTVTDDIYDGSQRIITSVGPDVSPVVVFDISVDQPSELQIRPWTTGTAYVFGVTDVPAGSEPVEIPESYPARILDADGEIVPGAAYWNPGSRNIEVGVLEPLSPDTEYTLRIDYMLSELTFRTSDHPYIVSVSPRSRDFLPHMGFETNALVDESTEFEITFSEDMDPVSLDSAITITDTFPSSAGQVIPTSIAYDSGSRTATVSVDGTLEFYAYLNVGDTAVSAVGARSLLPRTFAYQRALE